MYVCYGDRSEVGDAPTTDGVRLHISPCRAQMLSNNTLFCIQRAQVLSTNLLFSYIAPDCYLRLRISSSLSIPRPSTSKNLLSVEAGK